MKKTILFLIFCFSIFSKDISVKLSEAGINKFLMSVGSFKSEKTVNLKVTTLTVVWKVSDATVTLAPKNSKFNANIEITTGDKVRNGTIIGDAVFSFNNEKQILMVNIENMKVRGLDIYNVIGFYKPKYELPIKIIPKDKIESRIGNKISAYFMPTLYDNSVTVVQKGIIIEANIGFVEVKK